MVRPMGGRSPPLDHCLERDERTSVRVQSDSRGGLVQQVKDTLVAELQASTQA